MKGIFTDKNEWAIILGGSSGLGLASALKLAHEGMNIIVIHRDRKSVLSVFEAYKDQMKEQGVEVLSYNMDATRADRRSETLLDIQSKLPAGHKIKSLVFSIARGNLKPLVGEDHDSLTNDDFRITIDAMAVTLHDWVRDIHRSGLFAADARVISFTSEGNQRAWKNYSAVSAAKAALEAISRSIALEYARFGIKSNCIQAGVTDTQSLRVIPGHDELKALTLQRNPYGRLTTPQDVADVVYLLCRDEAKWINGAIIPVDGGERIV